MLLNLTRRIKLWLDQKVLSEEAVQRILDFEALRIPAHGSALA